VNRAWTAVILGGAFVGIVDVLGHHQMATPMPFWLLLPGLIAAMCIQRPGFSFKDNHPFDPVAELVLYAVNVAIYAGVVYLMLRLGSEKTAKTSK
jgi:hypothetical protein